IEIFHGRLQIVGYRINNFAYLTDCSFIPVKSYPYLQHLELLVLDALRKKPHPTHFTLEQAVCEAEKIGAKLTYFTHMTHHLDYEELNSSLPSGMQLAYDGLSIIMADDTLASLCLDNTSEES
ncbi:MAG TPA: MBL fold metallo-hydrolase, partial [Desulfobacterales bacterium]|nr:MBL fold metallo-hydrolase [Desulfobacterales bacterium]